MSFFYFAPRTASLAHWRALGRTDQFDGDPIVLLTSDGPEGRTGTIFHRHQGPVLPSPIRWEPVGGEYWVGCHDSAPPGPEDLIRRVNVTGPSVRLLDGAEWIVPLILPCRDRDPNRKFGLPCVLDSAGRFQPRAEYEDLIADARAALAAVEHGEIEIDSDTTIGIYAAAALGVAYRVGIPEVALLRLLDVNAALAVLSATIDLQERLSHA